MTRKINRPCTIQQLLYRTLVCVVLLSLFFTPGLVFAAPPVEVSPDKPAEYMIYQYPGVALLIRIEASGIEFESRVLGPEQLLVMASRIPGGRLGPVYQLIEAVEEPRQLIVQVRPREISERSRISMELVQLSGKERNSTAQLQAFRLLSLAAESTQANDTSTWAGKIYTLKRAAQAFEQLGWEELRLWSEYYAAHLVFFRLHDNLSTLEFARQVETAARKAGIGIVELAALQLEGAALLEFAAASSGQKAAVSFDEAHRVYQRAATMADGLGLQLEKSRAIFNDGLAWEQQGNLARALEQYERALSIAVAEGNPELENLARNKVAFVYEMQGSLSGAIDMLDEASDKGGDDGGEESENLDRAKSLFEKGRLLAEAGRFPQAVEALAQSLQLQRAAGSRNREGPTGLLLGQSYYGMGHMEQAETVLREAVNNTRASGNAGLLGDAFNSLAGIGRFQGEPERMAGDREQQGTFLDSGRDQAKFIFEQSLDALALNGTQIATASTLFSRSRQRAIKAGDKVLQHRSILYLCSLASSGKAGGEQTCSYQAVRQSVDFLVSAGIPAYALEAKWLWSKYLRAQGRLAQAIQQMSQLVEDMRFYRSVLPGVLGAWYWENREEVYEDYMSMVLKHSAANDREFTDGRQTLVALDRLMAIERPGGSLTDSATGPDGQDSSDQIRSLLAKNQQTPERTASTAEVLEINEWLRLARDRFAATDEGLDVSGLNRLLRQMSAGSALLSYYFSGNRVYVLVGRNDGVLQLKLRLSQDIKSKLAEVRARMGKQDGLTLNTSLDSLGKQLIAPIESLLPELVYLMPTGPLSGFPFDLLRRKGRYLAEKHQVINIMSPATLSNTVARTDTGVPDPFFLAGKPDIRRDVFDYGLKQSAEIRAIADIFVGPSLHIVQGSALGRDEFQGGRFESANIIHLAIPGTVNLEFPGQSRMMLSGTRDKPVSEFLEPGDIRKNKFQASLVVLSALNIEGTERFSLDYRLGFVSDFLASGVSLVVTSLWRIPDPERARFFAEFYRNLENNPEPAAALAQTRRAFLSASGSADYIRWGGFQIYID
jgi:CHAT domain-containing protein/tetratricopeptide (TPR) repeat protein